MRRAVLCGFVIAALSAAAAPAIAAPFAPLDRPGPKLRTGFEQLRSSLRCSDGIRDARRTPVLLLPATTVNSKQNFGWNYERLLAAEDIPYCASDQTGERNSNMTDIQTRARVRHLRDQAGLPDGGPADLDSRPQPGRDDDALPVAILAGYPANGRRRDRLRTYQPRL